MRLDLLQECAQPECSMGLMALYVVLGQKRSLRFNLQQFQGSPIKGRLPKIGLGLLLALSSTFYADGLWKIRATFDFQKGSI